LNPWMRTNKTLRNFFLRCLLSRNARGCFLCPFGLNRRIMNCLILHLKFNILFNKKSIKGLPCQGSVARNGYVVLSVRLYHIQLACFNNKNQGFAAEI
jgi:hypothetical protein